MSTNLLTHREPVLPEVDGMGRTTTAPVPSLRRAIGVVDALAAATGIGISVAVHAAAGWSLGAVSALVLAVALGAVPAAAARRELRPPVPGAAVYRPVIDAILVGLGVLTLAAALTGTRLSRTAVLVTAVLVLLTLLAGRMLVRRVLRTPWGAQHLLEPLIILGGNDEAHALHDALASDPCTGFRVIQLVPAVEDPALLCAMIGDAGIRSVALVESAFPPPTSNLVVRELGNAGVHVDVVSSVLDISARRIHAHQLGPASALGVVPVARTGWRPIAKRAFDIAGAGLLLLLALPLLAAAAVAVRLDSPGPVIFRQERVGRHGGRFKVLKLRTMVVDAEARLRDVAHLNEADGPLFKITEDPRVTRVGRFLRRTSIDELPQLINVLRNEMSLVGPRPALPREVDEWGPTLHQRLRVQPGITGMWQVSGRSAASFDTYERLDLWYVDNWSLVTDLEVLARTVPVVLFGRGAF